MQRCRKGRQWMANVSPFNAFSRAVRFESSAIFGEWPFSRWEIGCWQQRIDIAIGSSPRETAHGPSTTERGPSATEPGQTATDKGQAQPIRAERNRVWAKRNLVWIQARHEAQSPNACDHRVAEHVLNLGRSGDYNLRSKSPRRPTTKTLAGRDFGASHCYVAIASRDCVIPT